MKIGDRVRWLGAKEGSWVDPGNGALPGLGEIVAFDPARPYFPGQPATKDQPTRGPAVNVRLDGPKAFTVWASVEDVMPELV